MRTWVCKKKSLGWWYSLVILGMGRERHVDPCGSLDSQSSLLESFWPGRESVPSKQKKIDNARVMTSEVAL